MPDFSLSSESLGFCTDKTHFHRFYVRRSVPIIGLYVELFSTGQVIADLHSFKLLVDAHF